jgi:RNA polymerase sigma factor FliA
MRERGAVKEDERVANGRGGGQTAAPGQETQLAEGASRPYSVSSIAEPRRDATVDVSNCDSTEQIAKKPVEPERRYSIAARLPPPAEANRTISVKPSEVVESPPPVVSATPGVELGRSEQERMMVEHLPIVRFLARRIHERLPQHVDIEDLVSAGVLGLMDAFTKFDPEKKVQFRSYAQFRIRGAILDSLRTLDWSPRDLRRKGRAVEEAIRTLTARFGRTATESEVAAEMNLGLAAYQQLLGELKGLDIGTLHMERSEDSGEEELAYIPNKPDEDPLFRCLRGEMRQRLADAIAELPERERLVMTLYYYEEMTMKEIGLTLGVVESRVSQIHASAVLHLRVLLADLGARRGPAEKPHAARSREERRTPPGRGPRAI